MRRLVVIAVVLGLTVCRAWADGGSDAPFRVGEKLTYQIFWGPFVVGRATLEVRGIEAVDGHDCYHLVAQAKTSGLAESLFPVDSRSESWLDVKDLYARRFRQNRKEGRHRRNDETRYDYDHQQAIVTDFLKGKERRRELKEPVQDIVSVLYYLRSQPLKLYAKQNFVINASDQNYTVTIKPDQRKSLWVRPVGEVQALRIEPNPTLKIVAANKGRMWFWVSDDARRLPLIVASDLKLGSTKLVLFKIESANPELDNHTRPSTTNFRAALPGATLATTH